MNKKLTILIFITVLAVIGGCMPHGAVIPQPTQPYYTPTVWQTPTWNTPTPTPTTQTAKWTFIVYIDGDNDLEPDAIRDLNEMEMVGSTASVNIVVQIDRIPGYDTSNGDWTGARRYYVTKDYDPGIINSTLLEDLGEVNMGDPQTLVNFVTWAVSNYPAQNYAVVIWNHGGGFRKKTKYPMAKDIAIDDTSNDSLKPYELSQALSSIKSYMGKKIELLGMDACLMSMIEIAYEIKDYADVMVASEENEPLNGWPYNSILNGLISNPNMSPHELGSRIVDDYIAFYQGTDNVTLSAIDLNRIDPIVNSVNGFAQAVINDNLTNPLTYINDANTAQYYGDESFIDLYHFMSIVVHDPLIYSAEVKSKANEIMIGIDSAVIQKGSTYSGSNFGLSIYFPYIEQVDSRYAFTKFAQHTYWDEMLRHLGF